MFATINLTNNTVAFHADETAASAVADAKDHFLVTDVTDLEALTGPQAVALYNETAAKLDTNIVPVNRFSNKQTAAKRVWANLEDLQEQAIEAAKAKKAPKAKKEAAPKVAKPRKSKGVNLAPLERAYACREGSKQAALLDALARSGGASMAELLEILSWGGTPWKEVTVKSGLNWDMNKVKGYGIRTEFQNGYERWLECDYESMDDFASKVGSQIGHPDDHTEEERAAFLQQAIANGFDPEDRTHAVYHIVLPAGMTEPLPHTPRKGK